MEHWADMTGTSTIAVVEAAREAIEPFAYTSMDGFDMERALPAAFRAMITESRKAR
jgi:hypothetical protein